MFALKRFWLLTLLHFLSPALFAATTGPAGIWATQVQAVSLARFPGGVRKVSPTATYANELRFDQSGTYDSLSGSGAAGQWKASARGKKYRVNYDLTKMSAATSRPPFIQVLLSQYTTLATARYGANTPGVRDVKVLSYRDAGQVIARTFTATGQPARRGQILSGLARIKALVYFVDPATKSDTYARLTVKARYIGNRYSAPSACCSSSDPAVNLDASESFLADNAQLPNVETTASGLQYRVVTASNGSRPGPAATVTVNYRGILPSGQYLFGETGAKWKIGTLIQGLAEGVQLIPSGSWYRLYIPPALAFGATGRSPSIPPNSPLIFDVQLTAIE